MTAAVELIARLIVVMTLINYSVGASTVLPSTSAASNTTVASSTSSADIFTSVDSTDSGASQSTISTVGDATPSTLSSGETSLVSSTASPSSESTPTTDTPTPTTTVTTSLGTGDNSTEDTLSTAPTTSTTPTTTSTSTSIAPTTTKTPPEGTQEPDFSAAPPFKVTFSIGFNIEWDDSFTVCSGSQKCLDFQHKVQAEIDIAFIGCPGYANGSIADIRFYNSEEFPSAVASQLQAAQFTATGNLTYAAYSASFDNQKILSQRTDVVNYIATVVAEQLASNSLVINGSTDGMANDADKQMLEFSQNSCKSIGKEICPSICYPCINGETYDYNVGCQTSCGEDQICTADLYNNVSCACKENYLPIGGDCVHENWIIGITAGVGGAIILGLLFTAIAMGCKLNKKDKQYDHLIKSSSRHPAEAYAIANHNAAVSGHDVELHDVGHESAVKTEPVASAPSAEHGGLGSETAKENHHDHRQPPVTVDELTADYDEAPAANSIDMQNDQSDHYRSLYYSMLDNPGSSSSQQDPYAYFVPILSKIDVNKEYHIKRPQVQHPQANEGHRSPYSNGTFF